MHGLTPDGLDAIEDVLDCIALLLYYNEKDKPISPNLWKLYPQLMYVICGGENDPEGGFAFEYLGQISVSIQNFIAKDPQSFLTQGDQQMTYMQMTFKFLTRVFSLNRNGKDKQDGIVALKIIMAILENL